MSEAREKALALLKEHNREEGHIQHAFAVEATMRYFGEKKGEDPELWGLVGLLHDIDWEETQETPEKHCSLAPQWLKDAGYSDEIIRAVQAHGWSICSDVEPLTEMEKTLFAIDELTGLIITTALVRPGKSLQDLKVKSVKKKWKDKRFAAGVDREIIIKGAEMLGVTIEDLIDGTIEAMKPVEKELGLGE